MIDIIQVLGIAFFVLIGTYLLVPLNIRLSNRWGIIALPSERKIHKLARPEAGGLSFAILIVIAQAIVGFLHSSEFIGQALLKLSAVGIVAIVLGVIDDKYDSKARYKFLGQICLGIIMYIIGYRVHSLTNPMGSDFILGWMSFPITVIWYLVMINAINLIDGIDGLACGITIIVSAILLVVGIREQNILAITLSSLLMAGNLGFIRYNFFPAKIFMGDTGSLFIGLNIAAIATAGSSQYKGITTMTLMIPISVMAIPLIDVLLAVSRRIKDGNLFKADRAHLHHTMLDFGLSQRAISIIVYIATFLFGLIAIGFSFSSKKILFSVLLGLMTIMVIVAYILMRQEDKK
ncbi:MAG: undecaprenyl/decaprenyl-phosphate alpha-N-acetylglucosaminyl 1-phosphate transferase [Candidatus Cloacimonetes bacterium HGW-Cloacimonetes-1]|jgi:UDP-GlcNAc:undecaprenyl-phosphate GlcNAc-1-phosphate transferase|nr:MAG: undecaprenyl/decaprenyl-phosphate alpha-N-acetylglucosaminyl 1-phosphate transferase [Candidatus Cloacimonetes bacterium HGW-Cloacimonetes-1]